MRCAPNLDAHTVLSPLATAPRAQVIDEFRRGITKVLISTNVLARGIDVPQVSLVINFDIPLNEKGYPDADVCLWDDARMGAGDSLGHPVIRVVPISPHSLMG